MAARNFGSKLYECTAVSVSDPEQEAAPEQVPEFRLQQDVSEWLVNFVTLRVLVVCLYIG